MRVKIFSLIVVFLVSASALIVVIFNSSPEIGESQILAFFIFVYLLLGSFGTLAYLFVKKVVKAKEVDFKECLRRSSLFALLVDGILVLNSLNIFNVISLVSLVLALILIEVYFSLKRNDGKSNNI